MMGEMVKGVLTEVKRIAVIDDTPDTVKLVSEVLAVEGVEVLKAYNGVVGLEMILQSKPDLVLLDVVLPGLGGYEICRKVKSNPLLWSIPIIFLTSKDELKEKVEGLYSGVDDYITKPFEMEELLARIRMIFSRSARYLDANPLTKLPGNCMVQRKISEVLDQKQSFAVCYLDINHFKSFNDQYGFLRGDKLILALAHLLVETVQGYGSSMDFVGHIGGDDFIVVTTVKVADSLCDKMIQGFDRIIPSFYDSEDRDRGVILLANREGILQEFPLATLSIAVVTNENNQISHAAQISAIAADLKSYAKKFQRSCYVKDRRLKQPI
ncbi:MAG: response regulator [Chlamydiae bacterium]|nr:response regulator [Chlamydiota bacterium]MBI3277029.1 response regulator [Chlamydiota bacterium]